MKKVACFFIATLLCTACESGPKPNEPFYCKIDGKKFRPDSDEKSALLPFLTKKGEVLAVRNEENKLSYITVTGKDSKSVGISAKFENINDFKEQRYEVNEIFRGSYTDGSYNIGGNITKSHLYKSINNTGYVNFTKIDTVRQRISGTFEFKAKSIYTGKEVKVTNGSFNDVFFF